MKSGAHYYTVATLSRMLNIRFDALGELISKLGIEPEFHLNDTPYFDQTAIRRLDDAASAHDRAAAAAGVEIKASAAPSDLIIGGGEIELQAAAGDGPVKVRLLAYSGGVMAVGGFGNVLIDLAGMSIPSSVPLLAEHDSSLAGAIGSVVAVSDGSKLEASGSIVREADQAGKILALARGGMTLQASVGAQPTESRMVRPGESVTVNGRTIQANREFRLVTKSTLREISVVAIGADADTSVSIAAQRQGKSNMTQFNDKAVIGDPGDVDPIQAERTRVAGITALHERYGRYAQFGTIAAQAVNEGWPVDKAELTMLRASRPAIPNVVPGGRPVNDTQLLAAAAALRLSPRNAEQYYGAELCNRAAGLRVRSLRDLCARAVEMEMGHVPTGDNELVKAAFSTASLPNVLSDVASKEALGQFRTAPSAWRSICRKVSVKDFKAHRLVRLLLAGKFEQVGDGGELKHHTATDDVFEVSADTAGKLFGLTRKDIINDDAGSLMDTASIIGRKGASHINRLFAQAILGNANNFFGTGNGNYVEGAETALSVAALITALAALRNRKDADGENLDVAAATLLCPPSLEYNARAILNSVELARYTSSTNDQRPAGNPLAGVVSLEIEPRLENSTYSGNSAKAWYLWSQASDGGIVAAFLNGVEAPTIEQIEQPANILGVLYRGYLDVGIALADPAAAYKSKGEA